MRDDDEGETAVAADTAHETATRDPEDAPTAAGTLAARDRGSISNIEIARYRVTERLGHGGMGEVFAAHDDMIGREIAIKRMLTANPTDEQVSRFLREARIQGTLDHPSIPPVHELAHDPDGRPYFVMKKLAGITLSRVLAGLAKGAPDIVDTFPRQRLLRAFAEVCLAIERAHTRGVVHRDLKPSNIMFGDFGEVYVLDWGVAKVMGEHDADLSGLGETPSNSGTQTGAVIGTPRYMAPEQCGGGAVDGRADVYSLGCILFEILEHRPFRAGHDAPSTSGAPELVELYAKATSPDPARRPASARELGDRVQRFLDGDRDLVVRTQLAVEHLARARAALAKADDGQVAMQEAARALALDPTLPGAAELIGRLMIEPPKTVPPEVEASFTCAQERVAIQQSRVGMVAYLAYVAFIPILWWTGIGSPVYFGAMTATVVSLSFLAWYASRVPPRLTGYPPRALLLALGNALMVGLIGRLMTPFLVAPGVATIAIAFMIGSPIYRNPRIVVVTIVAMIVAILGPWLGELAGWFRTSTVLGQRTLTLHAIVEGRIDRLAVNVGLALYVTFVLAFTALLLLKRSRIEEDARRRLEIQSWRLRQLVADATAA